LAAVPSTGRATEVEPRPAPEAEATRALYERHAGQVYSFCLHRLGSREEAEDAVQSTFLNAFRGLSRGIVPESESAWLFKIAENVCLTRHRSTRRRGRVESPTDVHVLQDVVPAREHRGDELMPLGAALAGMPDSQRRAILLREWQGLSYREIAEEMELSQSAVETLIFRARRSLANALETPWERPTLRRAGRRAFDLGSLLAGLKTLFAAGTAAKVAAVAAVAVTGTAALAVAESRQPAATPDPPAAREQARAPVSVRGPDSAARRGVAAAVPVQFTRAPERATPATRTDSPRGKTKVKAKPAAESAGTADFPAAGGRPAAVPGKAVGRPAVPPGRAKEKPVKPEKATRAVPPGRAKAQANAKPSRPDPPAATEKPKAEKPEKPEKPAQPEAVTPPAPPAPQGPSEGKGADNAPDKAEKTKD
jgi:RNA polymerase sigma factor (sigma-70 family)